MDNKTKLGGATRMGRVGVMIALTLALVASLFTTQQQAEAIAPLDDVAVVTLSAPEDCKDPFWEFVNYAGNAHVADPTERTTLGYLFEPGHHFFRVSCNGGTTIYRFGVTGPTTNTADQIEEMRWTHRAAKCRDCEVIVYHPEFIASDLPEAGYRDPVSWTTWLETARSMPAVHAAIDLTLLDMLATRDLIGTAAIIIEPGQEVRVQVSHINY